MEDDRGKGEEDTEFGRLYLLKEIKGLTRSLLEDLVSGRSPTLYIDKFSTYCIGASGSCCCRFDLPNGKEILTLQRESHARRLVVLLRVLLIVQQLLQENKHGSKRDIYYMYPSVFREQSVVDRAINDICILLRCSRHNLNVVSVGNGLVMGWLRFTESGRRFDCINCPNMAHHIPVLVEEQMAYDAESLRLPEVRWLGAFPSDCKTYQFPQQCLLPLTAEDKQRLRGMLRRCYMELEPHWRSELELLLDSGVKFEIEALSANSISFLAESYLPSKIQSAACI